MKNSKLYLCLIILISFFNRIYAQNFVGNNGFELNTGLPTGAGQYYLATGWDNCAGGGSPDYFHINGTGLGNLPNSFIGQVNPHSGNAIMGLCPYYPSNLNFREYLSRQLDFPLTPGDTYTISFYITNGIINGSYGGIGIRDIGFCFSNGALVQPGSGVITAIPQVSLSTIFYDSTWQQLSLQYIATSAFDHVTIGNFSDDTNTTDSVAEFATNPLAYYFFDDMDISPAIASAPVVSLTVSDTLICTNNCIDFTDLSTHSPTSWQWNFPGGIPASSTLQNPLNICYQAAGTYDVTLIACNAFGCDTLTLTNFIHSNALPVINLGNDTTLCSPDTLILNAGNGLAFYLWQDGSTNSTLAAFTTGVYWVTGSNGQCENTDSILLTPCNIPVVSLISSDTIFCGKQCIDFTDLSTNNPTSWQWFFPGADSVSSTQQNPVGICYNSYGSFDVTLIACNAAGCDTLFLPLFILEYQLPTTPVISQSNDTLYCTQAYSYAWYNTINPSVILSTNSFYVTSNGGSFFVFVSDSVGCKNSSAIFAATGISALFDNEEAFSISPNPATDRVIISLPDISEKLEITIYDINGKIVYSEFHQAAPLLELKTTWLNDGIYVVQVKTGKFIYKSKIIVNR